MSTPQNQLQDDVSTFAGRIKAKYPQYKDVDDHELTSRILAKHHEYDGRIKFADEAEETRIREGAVAFSRQRSESLGQQLEPSETPPQTPPTQTGVAPQGDIVSALQKLTGQVNRATQKIKPQPTPSVLPQRQGVPSLTNVLDEARANPDPRAQRNINIRDQVIEERQPTTMSGKIARNVTRVTDNLNPFEAGYNLLRPEEDIVGEETNKRIEAANRASDPEMIAERQARGQMSAPRRVVDDVITRAGADSAKLLGGVSSLAGIAPNRLSEYLNRRGQVWEEGTLNTPLDTQGNEVNRGFWEKLGSAAGDLGLGVGEIVAMKKASGLSLAKIMAIETALKTSDQPIRERAAQVAQATAMGRILDGHLSKGASAALFGAPTAVQSGTAYLQGKESGTDALLNTVVQAGAGAILGGSKTVPESPRTLDIQVEALKNGTRDAVLITKGEQRPDLPPRMSALKTREGVFYFDPQKVSSKTIQAKVRDGSFGEILGNVSPKPETGEPTTVVTAKQDGTEAQTSAVPPERANEQAEVLQNQYPQAQIEMGGPEKAVEVLAQRTEDNSSAQSVDRGPLEGTERTVAGTNEVGDTAAVPIHHSELQNRRTRNTEHGNKGQFKAGKLEPTPEPSPVGILPSSSPENSVAADSQAAAPPLESPKVSQEQTVLPGEESTAPLNRVPAAPADTSTTLPPTTGIAQRVETARRAATQTSEAPAGTGISGRESVERGRELLNQGRSPEDVVKSFETTGAISADAMALVRAKHEQLARAANRAFDQGGQKLDNPAFRQAEQTRRDWWEKSVKPMQTEWHKTGMAQQGETAIDTGTFYGLVRAFHDAHGKELTPAQETEAKQVASSVAKTDKIVANTTKAINDELGGQSERTTSRRSTPRTPRLEQIDVYFDSLAQGAKARIAARAEKAQAELKGNKGQRGAAVNPAAVGADIADYAIIGAAKLAKGGVNFARWSADMVRDFGDDIKPHLANVFAESQRLIRNKNADIKVEDAVTELRGRVDKGEKLTPEDNRTVWQQTSKYISRGMDFPDARNAAATDLGMTSEQVMRAINSQPKVKRLTDQLYRQMSDRRSARAQAEAWVRSADMPAYRKFITNLPSFFFGLKTFGHGTVGMITHAGKNIFLPTRWADYWPNFARQYRLAYDRGYHERMMTDLTDRPNYITAKRAGLANDPHRTFDDYQKQSLAKLFGKAGLIGSRGFDSLKLLRQDLFDTNWNKLSDSLKTPEMAQLLAAEVNHSTGVTKVRLPKAASTVFFAPSLEASRWAWVIGDNAKALKTLAEWKRATPEQKYYAKLVTKRNAEFVATYGSLLAMNQGLLMATGSKDRINFTDPKKGDWLRFKIAGRAIEPTGGIISMIDFLGKIGSASLGEKNPRESRFETMGRAAAKYGRGKLSPIAGTGVDIATQSDYSGRPLPWSSDEGTTTKPPYSWSEYFLTQQTPIPVGEAARDVYHTLSEQGVPQNTTKAILKGAAIGTLSGGTGVRIGEEYPQQDNTKAARADFKTALKARLRNGQSADLEGAVAKGQITESDKRSIERDAKLSSRQETFEKTRPAQALDRFERMNANQREEVRELMVKKAYTLVHSTALTQDEKDAFRERVQALGLDPDYRPSRKGNDFKSTFERKSKNQFASQF